jgi:lipopolysaccharide heptosyltransferase II
VSLIKQISKEAIRMPAESLLKVYLSTLPQVQFSPEKVQKILIFAYHGLGNFIMFTPALRLLRERYPHARIDLQAGNNTGAHEVLAGSGIFDNIYNIPYSAGLRGWLNRAVEIRDTGYDMTVNELHSHAWPLALTIAMSRAPFRLGHVTSPGWPQRLSRYGFVFNMPVSMKEDEHEVDRYMDLVEAAGALRVKLADARPFIHISDSHREFARRFFDERRLNGPVIGLQPGASATMSWKRWPADRYRKVIERLIADRPDQQFILFGTASEADATKDLARDLECNITVAAGKTDVKEVAALIERCDVLMCNDSGLMHVAVAVGTPVVAIYGPTDIGRTAPLGPGHTIIRHELPCSPCFRLEGDDQILQCPHHDCLMTITPEEVFKVTRNVLVGSETGHTAVEAIRSSRHFLDAHANSPVE